MGINWEQKGNWHIHGKEVMPWMETRPHYCDRGNYLVKLHYWGTLCREGAIDESDLWPRYFFDFEAAKAETIAWLKTRNLYIPEVSVWTPGLGDPYAAECCGQSMRS